jgi:hypothetical protein
MYGNGVNTLTLIHWLPCQLYTDYMYISLRIGLPIIHTGNDFVYSILWNQVKKSIPLFTQQCVLLLHIMITSSVV